MTTHRLLTSLLVATLLRNADAHYLLTGKWRYYEFTVAMCNNVSECRLDYFCPWRVLALNDE